MRAGSLGGHLADLHEIYQGQVVAKELLNQCEGVVYEMKERHGKLKCLFPLCTGELTGGWMMRQHFCDLHPLNYVTIPTRLCIPAGIPGIPWNPQEPGFQKKSYYVPFSQERLEKAGQTAKECSKTHSFFSGT
jgi:hypothetical protein